jgi:putative ABC transport system permease protein
MKHLGFWLRWSWRELRTRWLQVILIALIIALGTGMSTGMSGVGVWRMEAIHLSYDRLHMYDLQLELADGSYVQYDEVQSVISGIAGVEVAEGRLIMPALIDASTEESPLRVRGRIIGVDVANNGPQVSSLFLDEDDGRTLKPEDSGQFVAVMESKFAEHNGLSLNQTVSISGDISLELVGFGVSPEYFVIMPERGSLLSEGSFGVMYVPLETAQNMSDRAGLVNNVVILLAEGADQAAIRASIERNLAEAFPGVGFDLKSLDDDYIYSAMQGEVKTIKDTWSSIGTLFLLGAAVAAFNLIGRMVESQRRQVGIAMALGVPRRWIAFRPVLVGLQIALLGTILGPILGLGLSQVMADLQVEVLSLPYSIAVALEPSNLSRGIALGIIIPIVAVLFPIMRAVRVAPVDAIKSGYLVAKGGGLNKLVDYLPLPGKSFTHMPVRNLLRGPWRTTLTVLGIAIAILLATLFAGIMDSYVVTMDRVDESYTTGAPDRIALSLDGFYPIDGEKVATISDLTTQEGVRFFTGIETGLLLGGKVSFGEEEQEIALELHDTDAAIWLPGLKDGAFSEDQAGIVLSEKTARDLGANVGDTITLEHPYRESELAFRYVTTELPVTGIHNNPLRTLAYMNWQSASLMGLSSVTNYMVAMPGHGIDQSSIKAALMQLPGVTSVQTPGDFLAAIDEYLSFSVDIMRMVEYVMLVLAFIIAFNSTSINLDERVRDVATMFAFGLPIRTVVRMQMVENLIIGILGTAVGVVCGLPILNALMETLEATAEDFQFVVTLTPETLLTAVLLGIFVVAITPVFSIRRMRKLDIPSTLRVME